MKSLAVVVARGDGERVRRRLREGGWLRRDLKVRRTATAVAFPVAADPGREAAPGGVEEADFEPTREGAPTTYRELLHLPPEEMRRLPRSFDVVGDIVLVRLPSELEPRATEVGEALLEFVPAARVVGLDRGVRGPERRRALERIAGAGSWRTRHRENGLEIEVDLERAYFSPRLAGEHARVAARVRRGERVLDLCCGVGPFTLAIARDARASGVVAVDMNPEAIALLEGNLKRLGLGGRVRTVTDRLEAFLPDAPTADRAILNLPHEGIKYLPQVAGALGRGGTLHYYEVTARSGQEGRPGELEMVVDPSRSGSWRATGRRVVHPYSPGSDLVAYTLERSSHEGGEGSRSS